MILVSKNSDDVHRRATGDIDIACYASGDREECFRRGEGGD
jgi:hypothetical protein